MQKISFKRHILPHLGVLAFFAIVTFSYMPPVLEGKGLNAHDAKQWRGMTKEARDYNQTHEENTFWTNSMFGGMPTYQMLGGFDYNTYIIGNIQGLIKKTFPGPSGTLFLLMTSFYFLMIGFGVSIPLAVIGGLAYGFCSNNLISLSAGHMTKIMAIAFSPLVLLGVIMTMRHRKYLLGSVFTALFLAVQITVNHPQITYYLAIFIAIYMIIEAIQAIKNGDLNHYFKGASILVLAAILAVGSNASKLGITYEYSKASTRGESPLDAKKGNSGGLSKDYVLRWSYGIWETANLMIPDFMGGSSSKILANMENTETREAFSQIRSNQKRRQLFRHTSAYWGKQPMTSGPVYIGAVVCFLFVLGLFLVRGPVKWWIVITVVLAIMLAWGKNFMPLTNIFYNYFPFYNKFRTVTMILFLVQLGVPILGILVLKKIIRGELDQEEIKKAVKNSFFITGGFCLIFALIPGLFLDFTKGGQATQMLSNQAPNLLDAIRADRKGLLREDAFRSFVFILLAAGTLYLMAQNRLKQQWGLLIIGALVLVDLWAVNKRYVNDDSFVESAPQARFQKSYADQQILQDKNPNYRVLNLTVSPFNDATTSYYHKSIGGYHGAKMGRYQELIEYQIHGDIQTLQQRMRQGNFVRQTRQGPVRSVLNPQVAEEIIILNMLNMKYLILPGRNQRELPVMNPAHYGNAWFVQNIKKFNDADKVIEKVGQINPRKTVIYNTSDFPNYLKGFNLNYDSNATIKLTKYQPNELVYKTQADHPQFAVFSEIYYNDKKGWKVYVDGKKKDHIRVNYVLRGMKIPAGEHTIRFKFEPTTLHTLEKVSLVSSLLILIGSIGGIGYEIYRLPPPAPRQQPTEQQPRGNATEARYRRKQKGKKGKK